MSISAEKEKDELARIQDTIDYELQRAEEEVGDQDVYV
jgi:hypothetical protein